MANATKLPALTFFSWSRPEAPNPRLAAPIDSDDTTLTFTYAPKDRDGTVITGNFLMNCTNESGFTELMYVPVGGMSADGLTATGVIRGVRISGLDYTTGDTDFADVHEGDSPVGCAVNAVYQAILAGVLTGTIATNGTSLRIGTEADATVTLIFAGVTDVGFLRRNHTLNKVQFSNDGVTWTNIADVSASVLVKNSATDTTAGYNEDKTVFEAGTGVAITESTDNPGGDEKRRVKIDSTASDTAVDTPYTASEDIALGHPVSKTTTNNTVENTIISTLATAGTESTFNAVNASLIQSGEVADNKIAVCYDNGITNLEYIVIGTVALDKTVTWGTPVSLGSDGVVFAVKYMEDNKVAIFYQDNAGTPVAWVVIATISGTVPTLGTPSSLGAVAPGVNNGDIALIDTDKLVVAYTDTSDSSKGKVRCATVSGTTIGTWGTAVEFLTTGAGNAVSDIAITKSSTDKAIVFCCNTTDTNKGKGALVIATGTALAVATEVEIDANASTGFSADYITDGKVLVTWRGGASGYAQARVASVTGLNLTYPTAVTVVNGAAVTAPTGVCSIDATTGFVVYNEAGATDGKFNKLSISGTTLTLGTQYSYNGGTNDVAYPTVAKVSSKNKILICYQDLADSNIGKAEAFQEYDNSASLVGFATSTVLSGATVNSRSKGVIAGQTCVAGTTYYISTNGISSTNTYGIKVGVGKNATELDIDIDKALVTLNQSAAPTSTQLVSGDACIWTDTDDSACYLCYNHGGTVKTVALT